MHLLLLGTSGCHLCEQAEQIINACGVNGRFEIVDIADAENEHWQKQYAVHIPVLYHTDSQRELAWPFDAVAVKAFIASLINLPTAHPS
jgi:hypothetical protein